MNVDRAKSKLLGILAPPRGAEVTLASAPGRADFLNTHQDYKGLPVVPIALELRCYSLGYRVGERRVRFTSVNMLEEGEEGVDEFQLDRFELKGGGWFGDYVRAVFKVFSDRGFKLSGMDIALWSEIPVGSGLSSSAALEVSVAKLVAEVNGLELSRGELAEIAYTAEHDVMGIPCGRLDQYGSAYGGIVKLETRPPYRVERLPDRGLILVVADSGVRHRTAQIHPIRQSEIDQALRILLDEVKVPPSLASKLGYRYYEPRWEEISEEELQPYLESLPGRLANRVRFTVRMHRSTVYALKVLREMKADPEELKDVVGSDFLSRFKPDFSKPLSVLGVILSFQHTLLRDLYEVSIPRLEAIWEAMLEAGALGAKISGAGLGGAMIAVTDRVDHARRVREACTAVGCPSTWISRVGEGVRVDVKLTL